MGSTILSFLLLRQGLRGPRRRPGAAGLRSRQDAIAGGPAAGRPLREGGQAGCDGAQPACDGVLAGRGSHQPSCDVVQPACLRKSDRSVKPFTSLVHLATGCTYVVDIRIRVSRSQLFRSYFLLLKRLPGRYGTSQHSLLLRDFPSLANIWEGAG